MSGSDIVPAVVISLVFVLLAIFIIGCIWRRRVLAREEQLVVEEGQLTEVADPSAYASNTVYLYQAGSATPMSSVSISGSFYSLTLAPTMAAHTAYPMPEETTPVAQDASADLSEVPSVPPPPYTAAVSK
ncbi:hypothetical protein EDD21DRAFT_359402 [Dissophora ornata]|nr:hypothetical protein EDD21DRAFT_359402 [Dissophora ornata]